MQHSDSERSTESTIEKGTQEYSAEPTTSGIVAALNEGDHESAGRLLRDAMERSPDDKQLLRLSAKQRRQAERFTRVYALLKETRDAIAEDEFVRAVGAFREAANLSQGFSNLEQATFEVGIDEAGDLGDRNWRIARSLLEDSARLNPKLVVAEEHWKQIQAAEREETIANVLNETALAKPAELARARERLVRTIAQYPDDAGLANRLKSIESTIDDKRKWDERQKALKRLTDFRDVMQRETDPAEAPKYIPQSKAIAAEYAADPEFQKVLEDLKHQVINSERAATALQQDRIEDCLEECAWVLSRMRYHQLFLNLKKKAEEREVALVDEYTNSVSRIKELLTAGKLAEAEALCAKASAQLPQFEDLKELAREIELRRPKQPVVPAQQETAESAQRHVERGERNLRQHQYKISEQYFRDALKMQPEDAKLKRYMAEVLYAYARSELRRSSQSARQVLEMAARLLPETAVPADLAGVLKQRKELQAKDESARSSSAGKITALDAQVETPKKRGELISLREEAGKSSFPAVSHRQGKEAAGGLFGKSDGKTTTIDIKPARRPAIYRVLSIAAAVILGLGLSYWMSNRPGASPAPGITPENAPAVERASAEPKATTAVGPVPKLAAVAANTGSLVIRSDVPGARVVIAGKQYTVSNEPLKVELNADSYQIKGSHHGYKDFGPVTVAVNKAAETVLDVKLTPKPAGIEIRGAPADTHIKVDGVLLAKGNAKTLKKELSAGEHSIELSRSGYFPRTLTRAVSPGDVLVLTGRDLQLESSDARLGKNTPSAPHAPPPSQLADSQWQSLDKNNPDALHAFAKQYPDSPWAAQARQQAETVLVARENSDWNGADHNNRAALEDFLNKHPDGPHAATATNALGDLDRNAHLAEAQIAEETAWKRVDQHNEASLEAFVRDSPNSRYRSQADIELATIRLGRASANESAAVLTVIHRLANAWNAKDLESILALDRNLNKRVVKAELSQVRTVQMQISAASPPQIDGSQAVVLCRRQASQIFSDGTRKDIPESIVSYVLAKRDGNWTIEGTR